MAQDTSHIFREEAIEHYQNGAAEGHVLRIDGTWTQWSYWLLVGTVVSALLFSIVGNLSEYASGGAVIRVEGATELTAPTQCSVADVLARPGHRVEAGQTLVRFYFAQEEAELTRVEREHEGLVLRLLRDPGDQEARSGITSLNAQRELARSRIAARSVVAPRAGVVTGVRVRPGQALSPGDPILTLATDAAQGRVVAMVPAHFRPMIRPGMPIRLELVGFRFAYQDLTVERVSDEAVGPAEVRRYLGPNSADTLAVEGPVVLVQGLLPGMTFTSAGESFHYFDGMTAQVDVRVRTQSILVQLVPGLRDLIGGLGG